MNMQVRNLSANPKVQAKIEEQLEGYHAALRGASFNPKESSDWRLGYQAQKDGRVLSDRVLQYLMR